MKSRKALKRSSSTSNKSAIRRSVQRTFETLEERQLMTVQPWSDGLYYFPGGEQRAYLKTTADYDRWREISKIQFATLFPVAAVVKVRVPRRQRPRLSPTTSLASPANPIG